MPTINYCDYINGNDDTGDGTRTNPYKTITKASTGLTGGDEVRCAKSPDPTDLSGTLTWTNGNVSVATSVDLTGVLAAKDFIRKKVLNAADYDVWWEISSINSTTITLSSTFRGYSESGSIGQKLGVTDTGIAATSTTQIQVISASGSSAASRLKISGGWDLTQNPAAQTGTTYFWQSGTNKYGYGIYGAGKGYLTIEKLGGLRYNHFIYANAYIADFDYIYGFENAGYALHDSGSTGGKYWTINHFYGETSGSGLISKGAPYAIIQTVVFVNGTYAINAVSGIGNLRVIDGVFKGSTYSLYGCCTGATMIDCNFNNCAISVFGSDVSIYNPTNLLTSNITVQWSYIHPIFSYEYDIPVIKIKNLDNDEKDYCINVGGLGESDTSGARSGTCLKITPSSTSLYYTAEFMFPADASIARTLKFYAKMSADFDGSADAAIWFMGTKITDWTALNLTTDYAQYSITADADDTPMSGVYVLRIRVKKGTVGSIYIDDLSFS